MNILLDHDGSYYKLIKAKLINRKKHFILNIVMKAKVHESELVLVTLILLINYEKKEIKRDN